MEKKVEGFRKLRTNQFSFPNLLINDKLIKNLLIKDILNSKKKKKLFYSFLPYIFYSFPKIPIPTAFTWHFGGTNVYVLGDWDCWQRHIPLCHSGWEFSAIIPLFPGRFHYKFSVDGKWKYAPTHKIEEDFQGTFNNIVEIERLKKYFYQNESLLESRIYPNPGIKGCKFPKFENYNKNAPNIPPHFLNFVYPEISQKKNCFLKLNYFDELSLLFQVYLNHLFFFSFNNLKKKHANKLSILWTRIGEKILIIAFYFMNMKKKKIEKNINFNGIQKKFLFTLKKKISTK
jgi:hypothetical protein